MKKIKDIFIESLQILAMVAIMALFLGAASVLVTEASQIPTVDGPDVQGVIDDNDDLFSNFDFTVDGASTGGGDAYIPESETEGGNGNGGSSGHGSQKGGEDEGGIECLLEGHKYDEEGAPLSGWIIGVGSRSVFGSDTYLMPRLIGVDITDEDGYYCVEEEIYTYDSESCNLDDFERGESKYDPKTRGSLFDTIHFVFEVLQNGWGPVKVVVDGQEEAYSSDSFFDVWVEVDLGETEEVDFYNMDGEGGGEGPYTLTVTTNGDGEGIVESDDESFSIVCDSNASESDCEETYPSGTMVTLVVTPAEGSNFSNSWTMGSGTCTATTTPCQITMNSNIEVNAHFSLDGADDTPTSSGGGGGGGRRIELDEDGGSGSSGEVLGEQVSIVPAGAPNTGAGGTAPISGALSFAVLLGVLAPSLMLRATRNG